MFATIFSPIRDQASRQAPPSTAARAPAGERIYVVGDIHGRSDLLSRIHEAIRVDIAERGAPPKRTVVYLGDYVDRGPNSREVIDMLIDAPIAGARSIHLKGNHEDMMLRFIRGDNVPHWLHNGGDATLASYGVVVTGMMPDTVAIERLRRLLYAAVPAAHLAFLEKLELFHVAGDYAFVHAGIRPGVPLEAQRAADLLWIRDPFLTAKNHFDKCVVHGHTISTAPEVRANRIGIDTGAFFSGRLTCLVLEDDRVGFLQT